ncbi:hypothetical protein [Desulfolithobacter sp.]
MIGRWLKTIGATVPLLLVYWLILWPGLLVRSQITTGQFLTYLLIWAALIVGSLPLLLGALIRRFWFFPGTGEPVAPELLQSLLLSVNEMHAAPVLARKKRKTIIVAWRCEEGLWCERMDQLGLKRLFELKLRFDPATRTVIVSGRSRSVDLSLCPVKVQQGWLSFPRPFFGIRLGSDWGFTIYRQTRPEDYSFSPGELLNPVVNEILRNGWNIRLSLL